ncbi:serine/threonine protein kinase [Dictyobacter arantiisoli]|uniref:Protein kinase domain-containing protein n=1 Tax=Dictyobacter arantiisoli TaxID=2014874 RepID=A0A5A5TF24_9CHLR|nr:serine/threonine-protein kinase [Dictyobacter arantiisoli]GCF10171.1 hypothetical protein KDI_37350 [Dictyobacter arantiisoli]
MSDFVGKQFGNYLLTKEIARGGFGTVYQAEHTILTNKQAAIKVLHDIHLNSSKEREAFLQEAQFLDKLKHHFILPFIDVGIQQNIPFLITEYAVSGSLRKRLEAQSPRLLRVEESLTILSQIGQALHYAHQQTPAIIHRDLKPDNILFNQQGEALLADFGIATILSTASLILTRVTGTPPYMAPEQFRGYVSRETDQYSLGCIAYELFTGQKPFTAPDFVAMGFKHADEMPIPPTQLNPDLPQHVEDAILKAMAKRREDRYPDVVAFVAGLYGSSDTQRKTESKDQQSRPPSPPPPPDDPTVSMKVSESLDPKTVLERIRRNDVPSTWHVLKKKVLSPMPISDVFFAFFGVPIFGGYIGLLSAHDSLSSLFSFHPPQSAIIGAAIGLVVGLCLTSVNEEAILVFMPNGFIVDNISPVKNQRYIISYKEVEDIRFDSTSEMLIVVKTTAASGFTLLPIGGFHEAPHLIAQRVEQAYTRFRLYQILLHRCEMIRHHT